MTGRALRLFAVHDAEGRIRTLLASPQDAPLGRVGIGADEMQTELEVPEMTLDLGDPRIQDRLAELIENYQVECGTAKARFVRKAEAKTRQVGSP
jgi:hypothetical protein